VWKSFLPTSQKKMRVENGSRDWLAGRSIDEKLEVLKTTSYRDYLIRHCGCGDEVANCFQGRTLDFFGLGCDAVAAGDVRDFGYPGFDGLGLPAVANPERSEPYIYHFPDGNASLARLLVRSLVPAVAPGNTMDDIVLAPFDYDALDRIGQNTRIRLNATCVNVRDTGDEVLVGYVRDGASHRVAAKHVVLACFHMIVPYLMPQLPQAQRAALARNVKHSVRRCASVFRAHARRCRQIQFHRFSPQSGEKPKSINVGDWTHALQKVASSFERFVRQGRAESAVYESSLMSCGRSRASSMTKMRWWSFGRLGSECGTGAGGTVARDQPDSDIEGEI
jgi:hypothetical protein